MKSVRCIRFCDSNTYYVNFFQVIIKDMSSLVVSLKYAHSASQILYNKILRNIKRDLLRGSRRLHDC